MKRLCGKISNAFFKCIKPTHDIFEDVLHSVNCILTVVEIDPTTKGLKSVIFQNEPSIDYYGNGILIERGRDLLQYMIKKQKSESNTDLNSLLLSNVKRFREKIIRVPHKISEEDNDETCWHAFVTTSPISYKPNIYVIFQTDATESIANSEMLQNTIFGMLPEHVIMTLRDSYKSRNNSLELDEEDERVRVCVMNESTAKSHENVTVMFLDVVGFTSMADSVSPKQVMTFVNDLFSAIDCLAKCFNVNKVETAGDCYIAASGVLEESRGRTRLASNINVLSSALRMIEFSLAIIERIKSIHMPGQKNPPHVRIGMHTGPVVSGLIGNTLPKFGMFGDTMNIAARLEQTAPSDTIQISSEMYGIISQSIFSNMFERKDGVQIKGKTSIMTTFILNPARKSLESHQIDF